MATPTPTPTPTTPSKPDDTGSKVAGIVIGRVVAELVVLGVKKAGQQMYRSYKKSEQEQAKTKLNIHLLKGTDLASGDVPGGGEKTSSDPYVIFKQGYIERQSQVKQKDLNPVWDEKFVLPLMDPTEPVLLQVFDSDFASDDEIGSYVLDLSKEPIPYDSQPEFILPLVSTLFKNAGKLHVKLQLEGEPLQFPVVAGKKADEHSYQKYEQEQSKSILHIHVDRAENLLAGDIAIPGISSASSDPYVIFKQGYLSVQTESLPQTLAPVWNKDFELKVIEPKEHLYIEMWDKDKGIVRDDDIGTARITLKDVPTGKDNSKPFVVRLFSPGLAENNGLLYLNLYFDGAPLNFS
jgi:Ca2+-dependent lipid-binding protein